MADTFRDPGVDGPGCDLCGYRECQCVTCGVCKGESIVLSELCDPPRMIDCSECDGAGKVKP